MNNKYNNFLASIYLAILGDKIGFGNGDREKNYSNIITVENNPNFNIIGEGLSTLMIFRFISEGGIMGLDLENLMISDDTVMHLDTIKGFIDSYKNRDELYNNITNLYLSSFNDIPHMRDVLLAGRQTLEAIKNIKSGVNWKNSLYSKNAGGSGGPMRSMCIGLCFYQTNNLLKLIESCIMITSITHPNCTSFIGSIASSLFTSYAIKSMNPETWIFELIRLLESDVIDNIIEKIKPLFIENFKEDKKDFLYKLLTYVETSFEEYNYIIMDNNIRAIYPWKRMLYYYENFSSNKNIFFPGAGADDVIIIAYDCLLMSKLNYEKLIYTSMIHIGDSDTIGSIVSAWYGALYGFENVPLNLIIKNDTYYSLAENLAKKLYNKYYEKSIKNF
jgi:ADP-ribosylarginine hydrolase